MKYLNLFIVIFLFTGMLACKKVKELTYFNYTETTEFTIPSANVAGVGSIPTVPVKNNASTEFKNNGTDIKHVEEIKLQELKLSVLSPPGRNFDFLNSINIYISSPGIQEILLAYHDQVPQGVTEFQLQTTGAVLDPYIKADSYSLRIETVTDEILAEDVKIQSAMTFRVRAKLL